MAGAETNHGTGSRDERSECRGLGGGGDHQRSSATQECLSDQATPGEPERAGKQHEKVGNSTPSTTRYDRAYGLILGA